jgi:hypothetical protein
MRKDRKRRFPHSKARFYGLNRIRNAGQAHPEFAGATHARRKVTVFRRFGAPVPGGRPWIWKNRPRNDKLGLGAKDKHGAL